LSEINDFILFDCPRSDLCHSVRNSLNVRKKRLKSFI